MVRELASCLGISTVTLGQGKLNLACSRLLETALDHTQEIGTTSTLKGCSMELSRA